MTRDGNGNFYAPEEPVKQLPESVIVSILCTIVSDFPHDALIFASADERLESA